MLGMFIYIYRICVCWWELLLFQNCYLPHIPNVGLFFLNSSCEVYNHPLWMYFVAVLCESLNEKSGICIVQNYEELLMKKKCLHIGIQLWEFPFFNFFFNSIINDWSLNQLLRPTWRISGRLSSMRIFTVAPLVSLLSEKSLRKAKCKQTWG